MTNPQRLNPGMLKACSAGLKTCPDGMSNSHRDNLIRSLAEGERETVAPLSGIESRHDHRHERRMLVGKMAHVRVVNVASDEPAHGSAGNDVRSEVLLRGDA